MKVNRTYNIMDKLTYVKPVVKIDEEHEYTVNDSKNNVIFINQITTDKDIDQFEMMDKVIEAALGEKALEYINSLELNMNAYETLLNAIMAAIRNVSIEEIEEEAEKQKKLQEEKVIDGMTL